MSYLTSKKISLLRVFADRSSWRNYSQKLKEIDYHTFLQFWGQYRLTAKNSTWSFFVGCNLWGFSYLLGSQETDKLGSVQSFLSVLL